LQSLQGIIVDVTEMRAAELAREKARETERLLIEARWLSLRYQVNPHFLFNVLTSIEALSREAPDRIPDLTRQLAVYLRKTQRAGVTPLIPLREELKGVKAYLNVEKVRFEERLQIDLDVSDRLLDLPVPDMLLQPLIENAIKFGMATSGMPLKIRIAAGITDTGDVRIEVANTGKWVPEDAQRDHGRIGQANLRNRLSLLYAGSFALEPHEEKGWVRVEILLPGRWGA
jgi:two-component system, LytTR family, sensor kinase